MYRNKKLILKIIGILMIITGIIIIIIPNMSDWIYNQNVEISKEQFVEQMEDDENKDILEKLYQELKNRNEKLFIDKQENLSDPFSYEQVSVDLSEYGIENNIIGYIKIPKMDIELPILLGANSTNMSKGAVHLTETSYPIGGENTNSVIAAHRGWSWSKMFRKIEKLEIGDKIYIQNFREELIYEVYDIKIIDPTDINELLIEEGKDIITLITCHPYRVNTQRYVVKAKVV